MQFRAVKQVAHALFLRARDVSINGCVSCLLGKFRHFSLTTNFVFLVKFQPNQYMNKEEFLTLTQSFNKT